MYVQIKKGGKVQNMKWIKEITLEDIFRFEVEVYKTLLQQYEKCIDSILKTNYGFETIVESEVKKLNDDLQLAKEAIMILLNDKTDILFKDEDNHAIVYLNKKGWKLFKLVFKSLKERVIEYEKI